MHEQTPANRNSIAETLWLQGLLVLRQNDFDPAIELISAKMLPKRMAEYDIVSHW
jgi:hypothetical protein